MSQRLLLGLEEVLEGAGWDKPPRFYFLTGTEIDPTFEAFAEVEGHPCDVLQGMWAAGVRAPAAAFGMALVLEGERHLRLDELEARAPDAYASMLEDAAAAFEGDLDALQMAVETAWAETCAEMSPAAMPEHLRVHVRNSIAVLNSGWTIMVVRDQGGQPEPRDPVPPTRLKNSRVPDFMHHFLTGREPVD